MYVLLESISVGLNRNGVLVATQFPMPPVAPLDPMLNKTLKFAAILVKTARLD